MVLFWLSVSVLDTFRLTQTCVNRGERRKQRDRAFFLRHVESLPHMAPIYCDLRMLRFAQQFDQLTARALISEGMAA